MIAEDVYSIAENETTRRMIPAFAGTKSYY
jgi:hypothetical protein